MNMITGRTKANSSKSTFYVATEPEEDKDEELESVEEIEMQDQSPHLEVPLLEGEQTAYKAEKVLKLHDYTSKTGDMGHLYCTNFRLSFVTAKPNDASDECNDGRHRFIRSDDVILNNISVIYQVSSDKTSKKLTPTKTMSHPKRIHIHTKDVGIHYFSFEFTNKKDRSHLIRALQRFAFPQQHSLLFAHVFSGLPTPSVNGYSDHTEKRLVDQWKPAQYTTKGDWERELERLNATSKWRVTNINERFGICPSMSEYFVVPTSIVDELLEQTVSQLTASIRLMMWCYTHSNGYSLISVPPLMTQDQLMQKIRGAQPLGKHKKVPEILEVDLNRDIASVTDIKSSFTKMCALCGPETVSEFYSTDNTIYSQLDSSHWLRFVCSCLRVSGRIATQIHEGHSSVNIREDTSTDLSCVISSVVQVLLDSSCRTIRGFQNIIQRCWVAAGHPFCERLGIIYTSDKNVTPMFLLFLDCIYQLTVQYPSSFEFSEIYLITLWDSCVAGLFNEFIFDCDKDRTSNRRESNDGSSSRSAAHESSVLPTVWNWDMQFNAEFLSLFRNPLHEFRSLQHQQSSDKASQLPHPEILKPNFHPSQIDVWIGFFYRHTTSMQIINGGKPAEYFQQCLIMEEIIELQNQIDQIAKSRSCAARKSGLYFNAYNPSGNEMQAKLKASYITSTFPFSNSIKRNVSDISLCTMLGKSLVLSEHVNDDDDYI